jgi:hypothetical protein
MFIKMRSKVVSLILVFFFIGFYTPHLLVGQNTGTGNLLGFIYNTDGTTPLDGAILMLRNVSTGTIYESSMSDSLGVVHAKGVEEGLYIVGVVTDQGNYNVEDLVGIRSGSTAKVSLALISDAQEQLQFGGEKTSECPKGDWYIPEAVGECDEGYDWNSDNNRCECTKKDASIFAFFATPVGIAVVSAFAVGATIGTVELSQATTSDASPYK